MKTIEKIRSLALGGDVNDAITLALDAVRDDAPVREGLIELRNRIKALKREREKGKISAMTYTQEASSVLSDLLTATRRMRENPKMMKPNGLTTKWWFWALMALMALIGLRYYFKPVPPPPPPPDIAFTYLPESRTFTVDENADEELVAQTKALNQLFAKKSRLEKWLGKQSGIPVVRFEADNTAMKHTLQLWQSLYEKEIDLLTDEMDRLFSDYSVFYQSDQYKVPAPDKQMLRKLATFMQNAPSQKLRIVGYTDPTGAYSYNKELACKRANAVRDFMLGLNLPGLKNNAFEVACDGAKVKRKTTAKENHSKRRVDFELVGSQMYSLK